jgi:maltose alpha-D-glucosyltransferase/alpha-amylase
VTSAYLDRFVDEQRLLAASYHPSESEEQVPYLRYLSQAGRRVAEMHLALAAESEFADFAPEPIRPADVRQWIGEATERAGRIFGALQQRREAMREADRLLADQMLAQREDLHERLSTLLRPDADGLNIRHHGDFNLGRMLIVKDDIFITGFEGEAGRSLDERRRKAPAARDVAGLIRSIDYSATAALDRALKVTPDDYARLGSALGEWRDRATSAFLVAYREVMNQAPLWPTDPRTAGQMLDFFLLEKALHEIEYELAHRPDWLRLPLAGAIRIMSRHTNEAS